MQHNNSSTIPLNPLDIPGVNNPLAFLMRQMVGVHGVLHEYLRSVIVHNVTIPFLQLGFFHLFLFSGLGRLFWHPLQYALATVCRRVQVNAFRSYTE